MVARRDMFRKDVGCRDGSGLTYMTLQRRTVVVGEIICTDRFVHYNQTPIPPYSRERADYVPASRYQAQAQQCSVTESVVKHLRLSSSHPLSIGD